MSYCADKLMIDGQTHAHTHVGNDNTRRPKLASGKNHQVLGCEYSSILRVKDAVWIMRYHAVLDKIIRVFKLCGNVWVGWSIESSTYIYINVRFYRVGFYMCITHGARHSFLLILAVTIKAVLFGCFFGTFFSTQWIQYSQKSLPNIKLDRSLKASLVSDLNF